MCYNTLYKKHTKKNSITTFFLLLAQINIIGFKFVGGTDISVYPPIRKRKINHNTV